MSDDNEREKSANDRSTESDNSNSGRRDSRRKEGNGNGGGRARASSGGSESAAKQSAAGFLAKAVERSARADLKLKQHLNGRILIEISDEDNSRRTVERFLFDWRGNALSIEPSGELEVASAAAALVAAPDSPPSTGVDCLLRLSFESLRRIAFGDVNPQVAMLSGLVEVQGQTHFAIYFFNLVAPQAEENHHRHA